MHIIYIHQMCAYDCLYTVGKIEFNKNDENDPLMLDFMLSYFKPLLVISAIYILALCWQNVPLLSSNINPQMYRNIFVNPFFIFLMYQQGKNTHTENRFTYSNHKQIKNDNFHFHFQVTLQRVNEYIMISCANVMQRKIHVTFVKRKRKKIHTLLKVFSVCTTVTETYILFI